MNGLIIVGYTHICVEGTQSRAAHDIRSPGKEGGNFKIVIILCVFNRFVQSLGQNLNYDFQL